MKITKAEAATRQLNTAIRLFFASGDSVAIHTLAAAAGTVFADLVETQKPGISWQQSNIRIDSQLKEHDYFDLLRESQDFFKHADRDPDDAHDFDEKKNDDLISVAILDCGELQPTSIEMQVFQIWYFAAHASRFSYDHPVVKDALPLFPGIEDLPREQKITLGARLLAG
jgi:hypothetical protein